jgi:hypothetical protein
MLVCFIAVGKKYINDLNQFLTTNTVNYKIIILTDKPNIFKNYKTIEYHNKIFSYYDKLLFSLRTSEKYNEDVLYIDVDELNNHNIDEIIKKINFKETSVQFERFWPDFKTFNDLKEDRWELFRNYIDLENIQIEYSEIWTVMENVLYFSKKLPTNKILRDLELIKPIFEIMSLIDEKKTHKGIGNGESVALSFVLKLNNIPLIRFAE